MSNIIRSIINVYHCKVLNAEKHYKNKNRANSMGDALENFIKDSFADSFECDEMNASIEHAKVFSYLGNQNNPPDMILKDGDAIEVKKIESSGSGLALNSSYPKSKLYRDSHMLTQACKQCDGGSWTEKDIIYAVGVVKKSKIQKLFYVYGVDYAADKDTYERIIGKIKAGVTEIEDVEFTETNELGRVNKIDPLGITYLRIRGMWHIENPYQAFKYVYTNKENDFCFCAIIAEDKFCKFPKSDIDDIQKIDEIKIIDSVIKDPNNPSILKKVKVISFER